MNQEKYETKRTSLIQFNVQHKEQFPEEKPFIDFTAFTNRFRCRYESFGKYSYTTVHKGWFSSV